MILWFCDFMIIWFHDFINFCNKFIWTSLIIHKNRSNSYWYIFLHQSKCFQELSIFANSRVPHSPIPTQIPAIVHIKSMRGLKPRSINQRKLSIANLPPPKHHGPPRYIRVVYCTNLSVVWGLRRPFLRSQPSINHAQSGFRTLRNTAHVVRRIGGSTRLKNFSKLQ